MLEGRFLHNDSAQVYNQSQGKRRSPQVAKICIMQNDLIIPSNQVWSKAFLHVSRNSVKTPAELLQVQGSYALQIALVQFMSPDLGDLHRLCGMKRSVKHLQLLLTATACLYLEYNLCLFQCSQNSWCTLNMLPSASLAEVHWTSTPIMNDDPSYQRQRKMNSLPWHI